MSRVGKMPIPIPDKTKIEIKGHHITVTGPKGSLSRELHPEMKIVEENNELLIQRPSDNKNHRALHGLTRALVNNMVVGVTDGFKKELQMIGVGYRAEMKGTMLSIALGYSHPIYMIPPEGVTIQVEPKENKIRVTGIDKELVGQVASKIRGYRKPEPYKGKGVRYVGEHVRSKAGKSAG